MMRYRATLAYDGSAFEGFQRQAEGTPTIQAAVEHALQQVTQQVVTVVGAGRTDSGVHASGQVIAFDVTWKHTPGDLLRALNARLPPEIALQDIAEAAPDFHPRFSALARRYRYSVVCAQERQPLWLTRAWHIQKQPDVRRMNDAARLLIGTHDFAAFGKAPDEDGHTVREIMASQWYIAPYQDTEVYEYRVKANAFLQHMVRRLVGAMIDLGCGKITLWQFEDAFRRADPTALKTSAPPQGLILEAVFYPENKLVK
ncbi:MAG: tRNA pseudouridine(38-40) synthase TruA [Chloroflexi bacterium]|nr:tRNA pseudouridine(38-40) synthase TruA [Chloroflexota bacterium]